jgi:hypothetical protein
MKRSAKPEGICDVSAYSRSIDNKNHLVSRSASIQDRTAIIASQALLFL